jgi:hypothetical protein
MHSAMFQRTLPIVFLFVMATISPAYAENPRVDGLTWDQVETGSKNSSIGGIKRNMTETQVRSILGKPLSRQKRTINDYCIFKIHYNYKNLKIEFEKANGQMVVARLVITSRFYRTDQGIRVGDSLAKAQQIYPTLKRLGDSKNIWDSGLTAFGLTVNQQGKITKIELDNPHDDC